MENSAYVPNANHLNSPALVVFSQAGSGLQDALRLQRPFNPQFQMTEASKEFHRPFTASSFGLRHMEAYSGLPAHILNHLQPQFLHPGLSLGSGAFRPLGDLKSFPSPSAFTPPKCLKVETGSDNVHQHNSHGIFSPTDERFLGPSPRTDSCSPASASMSPQPPGIIGSVKEESMDAQMSEDGDATQSQSSENENATLQEENRGFRIGPLFGGGFASGAYALTVPGLSSAAHEISKNSFLFDHGRGGSSGSAAELQNVVSCIRSMLMYASRAFQISTFRSSAALPEELPLFLDVSINKRKRDLSSCPICGLSISQSDLQTHFMHELERLYKLNGTGIVAGRKRRADARRSPVLPGDSGPEGRWETFQRIKVNRQGRLRIKIKKRKGEDCPVCSERIHRSPETVNPHEDQCSRKNINEEDETVDVEGDSEFDEWAEGQRRRNNALGLAAPTPSSSGRHSTDAEADDVIVDGDELEESSFGPSQYTESDVAIKHTQDKKREKEGQSQVATVNSSGDVEIKSESGGQQCDSIVSTSDAEPSSRAHMIEELRSRIRQLEAEGTGETLAPVENEDYKCLICLEHYKKPVISTVCWHVHCEECWLHTLGSKKVCPQCSMITSPTDLRRIFM